MNYALLLHSGMSGEGSYKFPCEKLMRAKWIAAVRQNSSGGQKNFGITPHIAVCSSQHPYSLALHPIAI